MSASRHFIALTVFAGAMFFALAHGRAQTPLIIDSARPDRQSPDVKPGQERTAIPRAETRTVAPFILTEVRVSGTSIGPAALRRTVQPFIGKTIDGAGISAIAEAVSNAYADSNIAFYTVVAPAQDFAGGILKLTAYEGYVERVEFKGDIDGDLDLAKSYAAKIAAEKPLTKSTFQRYMSLIRDIPGLTAKANLLKGDASGATVLVIALDQKPMQFTLGVNNYGSSLLGSVRFQGDAIFNRVFRQGDQTKLALSAPTEISRYQFISLSELQPLDDDGTNASLVFGYLRTEPKGATPKGHAETGQFLVRHPFIRSFDENLFLSVSVDGVNSTNALLGVTVANERVRTARLSASYSLAGPKDVFAISATASFGIDGLGARVASPLLAQSDFHKLNFSVTYNRELGPAWVARLHGGAQYAGERLPVAELYTLGGAEFGRAFDAAILTGDTGMGGSAEIAWHPKMPPVGLREGSEIYGFADGGKLWYRARSPLAGGEGRLASAGGGIRLAVFKETLLQFEVSTPLDSAPFHSHGVAFGFAFRTQS